MGPVDSEPQSGAPAPTDDPAVAVREYDPHGAPRRLTRFFLLEQKALPWLPVSEAAFLLWVLVVLMLAWLAVGLVLYLT